jgi:hypothetical protein
MIAERVGAASVDELRFLNGAQELTNLFDDKTLIDLDIGDLSQINLVMRLRGGVAVKVEVDTYDKKKVKIDCDSADNILKVKRIIYEQNQELTVDYMDLMKDQ